MKDHFQNLSGRMSERVCLSVEWVLGPMDWIRARVLSILSRPFVNLLRDRDQRIRWSLTLSIVASFALVIAFPLLVFTLSPLLLGIPHLVSDVRYLVAKPKLHRDPRMLLVFAPLLALYVWPTPQVGLGTAVLAAMLARGAIVVRIAIMIAASALIYYSEKNVWTVGLGITHAHNVIAIAIAFGLFAPRLRAAALPTFVYLAGSVAILSGALDVQLLRPSALSQGWVSVGQILTEYAPDHVQPMSALRLFVWLQRMHSKMHVQFNHFYVQKHKLNSEINLLQQCLR